MHKKVKPLTSADQLKVGGRYIELRMSIYGRHTRFDTIRFIVTKPYAMQGTGSESFRAYGRQCIGRPGKRRREPELALIEETTLDPNNNLGIKNSVFKETRATRRVLTLAMSEAKSNGAHRYFDLIEN